jgi:hypothetical protein
MRVLQSISASACALLAACGGSSSSGGDSGNTATPASTTSTAGVLCSYGGTTFNSSPSVNANSTAHWTCSASARALAANGVPDHAVGTFPNPDNPNAIMAQAVNFSTTLAPAVTGSTASVQIVGYALNGVKMDPGTAGSCDNSGASCSLIGNAGTWRIEALGQSAFNFGTDASHAHVQPGGAYHYHGMPEGLITRLGKGVSMTLVGWAADGFPVYARWGYTTATDATSPLKVLRASWRLKAAPDAGRPATSLYAMGTFQQDWEYAAGSGDLDECNGRSGVTPEFPQGIYHYIITDSYPFIQRCLKGGTP